MGRAAVARRRGPVVGSMGSCPVVDGDREGLRTGAGQSWLVMLGSSLSVRVDKAWGAGRGGVGPVELGTPCPCCQEWEPRATCGRSPPEH